MNLRRVVYSIFYSTAILALAACSKPAPEQSDPAPLETGGKILYVGPTMTDCVGVASMTCLMVKGAPEDDYQMFYDSIKGFDYVPGYEYKLRVEVTERENVPEDASKLVYALVEVAGKKKAGRALEDSTWELKDQTGVGIAFQDGKASGHAGVNRYFGSYALDGSALTVGRIGSTRMAGPQKAMDQEKQFLEKLAQVAEYKMVGKELRLIDGTGQVVLVFSPGKPLGLTSVTWKATGVNNGRGGVVSILAGTEIIAKFDASGTLSGSGGCNNYTGGYELEGERLRVGALGQTRKMCARPEGIMEQESNYFQALEHAAKYRIDGKMLELRSEKGSLLVKFVVKEP
ncbi:MAG: hypothetical protein DRP64_03730 [Verrucomicrobia bacterium]|nr:MAG: hypothetical protein DRP64_03730 [Verrucomicrobiota bacterium]